MDGDKFLVDFRIYYDSEENDFNEKHTWSALTICNL